MSDATETIWPTKSKILSSLLEKFVNPWSKEVNHIIVQFRHKSIWQNLTLTCDKNPKRTR